MSKRAVSKTGAASCPLWAVRIVKDGNGRIYAAGAATPRQTSRTNPEYSSAGRRGLKWTTGTDPGAAEPESGLSLCSEHIGGERSGPTSSRQAARLKPPTEHRGKPWTAWA